MTEFYDILSRDMGMIHYNGLSTLISDNVVIDHERSKMSSNLILSCVVPQLELFSPTQICYDSIFITQAVSYLCLFA